MRLYYITIHSELSIITCSCAGMGPGSILLPLEYNLGICLSQAQRAHSVDPGRRCSPGKASEHVLHLVTSSVVKCAWNFVLNRVLLNKWEL